MPAISNPTGSVSVNGALRLAAVALVLLNVIVKAERPPALIVDGLKALPRVGDATAALTDKVAMTGEVLFP